MVGIRTPDDGTHAVHPGLIPEQVPLVSHIPHDVGESAETGRHVAVVTLLVGAAHAFLAERVGALVGAVHIENDRYHDAALPRQAKHALSLTEERDIEAVHVVAGILDV